MNILIETGIVNKLDCGNCLSYVLNDDTNFSLTEYRVLQNQSDGVFIKCMKLRCNGKIQLYYLTNCFKPLTEMLHTLEQNIFINIVANILSNIISVKNNGFLSCENIDISLEHIYVDPITYGIGLIYFPLSKKIYSESSSFENELRASLIKLIQQLQLTSSPKIMQMVTDLSDGKMSLEDIYSKYKGSTKVDTNASILKNSFRPQKRNNIKLVATNTSMPFEIVVTKDEFIIGKKQGVVDCAITFNKMISRSHCKIARQGEQFVIIDLGSANGTYVNGPRIQAGQPYPIKKGDVIRLANSEFQVSIE